jgi:hypothetical protein
MLSSAVFVSNSRCHLFICAAYLRTVDHGRRKRLRFISPFHSRDSQEQVASASRYKVQNVNEFLVGDLDLISFRLRKHQTRGIVCALSLPRDVINLDHHFSLGIVTPP